MIKTISLAALAAIAIPTAAQAQDNAAGARIEAFIGVEDFNGNFGAENDAFNPERDRDVDVGIGVGVGYDFLRSESLSAGVDIEYTYATAKKPVFVAGVRNGDLKIGSEVYGGGRVTFAVTPSIGIVGKVGYSYLDTEFTSDVLKNSRDSNLSGLRGALGVQFSGGDDDRSYYGLEARYTNYNKGVTRKGLMLVVGHRF